MKPVISPRPHLIGAGSPRLRTCLVLCVLAVLYTSSPAQSPPQSFASGLTTYEKFLPLATAGDPDVQNFMGYMLFHGEGVAQDYALAHYWFHQAAEQGNVHAQRNLALLHAGFTSSIPDELLNVEEANRWFIRAAYAGGTPGTDEQPGGLPGLDVMDADLDMGDLEIGRKVYLTFCGGCHGFNGQAAYTAAPSFARGERLDKSDEQLLRSLLDGVGIMPAWRDTLGEVLLFAVIKFIRTLQPAAEQGNINGLPPMDTITGTGDGEHVYATFCGGCHGFNGIAYYVNSPSFALGERMDKSDAELLDSIRNGKGQMPGWEDKLTLEQLHQVLDTVRSLQDRYRAGIEQGVQPTPDVFFRFRPLGVIPGEWYGVEFPEGEPE